MMYGQKRAYYTAVAVWATESKTINPRNYKEKRKFNERESPKPIDFPTRVADGQILCLSRLGFVAILNFQTRIERFAYIISLSLHSKQKLND